ncbi:MAG: hypothetical protein AAFX87_27935 [Bacteroidota bacterium]
MLTTCLMVLTETIMAQTNPKPFTEASKAIANMESKSIMFDSLRKEYQGRWTLGMSYGQRFITADNKTLGPDTITFADFTNKRSFFRSDFGYFIKSNVYVGLGIGLTFLPRVQEVGSISFNADSLSIEASGNGGIIFNLGLVTKYYFDKWEYTRPYVALEVGRTNLLAKGGAISFTTSNGRSESIEELRSNLGHAQVTFGLSHRVSPGLIFDFNLGYIQTTRGEPIGGLVSLGGPTTSLSLQFVLNPRKK